MPQTITNEEILNVLVSKEWLNKTKNQPEHWVRIRALSNGRIMEQLISSKKDAEIKEMTSELVKRKSTIAGLQGTLNICNNTLDKLQSKLENSIPKSEVFKVAKDQVERAIKDEIAKGNLIPKSEVLELLNKYKCGEHKKLKQRLKL